MAYLGSNSSLHNNLQRRAPIPNVYALQTILASRSVSLNLESQTVAPNKKTEQRSSSRARAPTWCSNDSNKAPFMRPSDSSGSGSGTLAPRSRSAARGVPNFNHLQREVMVSQKVRQFVDEAGLRGDIAGYSTSADSSVGSDFAEALATLRRLRRRSKQQEEAPAFTSLVPSESGTTPPQLQPPAKRRSSTLGAFVARLRGCGRRGRQSAVAPGDMQDARPNEPKAAW